MANDAKCLIWKLVSVNSFYAAAILRSVPSPGHQKVVTILSQDLIPKHVNNAPPLPVLFCFLLLNVLRDAQSSPLPTTKVIAIIYP